MTKVMNNIMVFDFVGFALLSMLAFFSLYTFTGYLYVGLAIFLLIFVICLFTSRGIISKKKKIAQIWTIAWFLAFAIIMTHLHFPKFTNLVYYVYGICFLLLEETIQKRIIKTFVILLAILFTLSLIEYAVFFFSGEGVVLGIVDRPDVRGEEFTLPYQHLIFNVVPTLDLFPRFCGLTEEPGLVGTLCGFLLFYCDDDKSLRYPFIIFIICGIFALSIAFFAILIFFIFSKLRSFKSFLLISVIVSTFIFMFVRFGGDTFEVMVLERVVGQDIEDIDDRTNDAFDISFNKLVKSGGIIWGEGTVPMDEVGAGAKKWLFRFGLVSFVIIFMAYLTIFKKKSRRIDYMGLVFLLAFWASFYQRETIIEAYTLMVYVGVALKGGEKIEQKLFERGKSIMLLK